MTKGDEMQLFHRISRYNLSLICLLAFVLRAGWALLVTVEPVSDSFVYNIFAQSIVSGKGYAFPAGNLTVHWPVGTSAIYAGLYSLFGISFLPIVVFNLVIGIAIVWLTCRIASRYLPENVAKLAALLVAIWPILIQFTTILASELIFIFLLLTAVYIWGSVQITLWRRAILWGAFICGATYVRPTALPLLLILPAVGWLSGTKLRDTLLQVAFASITAGLLFAPWVYRNYVQFNKFVLVSANAGVNLWNGNNPRSNGGYMPLPNNLAFEDEVVRDQYYMQEAVDYILNNPLSYLKLAVKRAIITYKAETIGVVWNPALGKMLGSKMVLLLKLISTLYWWMIVICALLGACILHKREALPLYHVLFVVVAFFFAFPLITVGQDRYHMPIDPFLALFAAYGLLQFAPSKTRSRTSSLAG